MHNGMWESRTEGPRGPGFSLDARVSLEGLERCAYQRLAERSRLRGCEVNKESAKEPSDLSLSFALVGNNPWAPGNPTFCDDGVLRLWSDCGCRMPCAGETRIVLHGLHPRKDGQDLPKQSESFTRI